MWTNRRILTIALVCASMSPVTRAQAQLSALRLETLRPLVGEWVGTLDGKDGSGTVRRSVAFALDGKFLYERTTATLFASGGRPSRTEAHWGLFSYDEKRGVIVLRRFHQNGSVYQFVLNHEMSDGSTLTFDSESVENADRKTKVRLSLSHSPEWLVETVGSRPSGQRIVSLDSASRFDRYQGERCADSERLSDLKERYGILILLAASDVVAKGDSVCVATLGSDWTTFEAADLVDRVDKDKLNVALDWVCGSVLSLPLPGEQTVSLQLEKWAALYQLAERIRADCDAESFATGVAYVPALAGALPPDIETRAPQKDDVGETLASAEHVALLYAVTQRLTGLPDDEMARVIETLRRESRNAFQRE